MTRLVGLMTAWHAGDWIEPALRQALLLCDEVLVTVGPPCEAVAGLADDTLERCRAYGDAVLICSAPPPGPTLAKWGARAFNAMIERSPLLEPGGWIFAAAPDEFIAGNGIQRIREIIEQGRHDAIRFHERRFLVDTRRCVTRLGEPRLRRVGGDERFNDDGTWCSAFADAATLSLEDGLFHYGLLADPVLRAMLWDSDCDPGRFYRTEWLRHVYSNWNVDDEAGSLDRAERLYGQRHPLHPFSDSEADEHGLPFGYDGAHPELVESAGVLGPADFREPLRRLWPARASAEPDVDSILESARELLAGGRVAEAERSVRRALMADPFDGRALRIGARTALSTGALEDAETRIRRALRVDPADAVMHQFLGVVHRRAGRTEEAISSYQAAVEVDGSRPEFHNNLGEALMAAGRGAEACMAFRSAVSLRPDYAAALYNLANADKSTGDLLSARKHYLDAIRIRPDHHNAHFNLANLLRDLQYEDSAIAHYEACLELRPDGYEARYNLARVLARQGRFQGVAKHFRAAMDRTPDRPGPAISMANLCLMHGERGFAAELFRRALEIDPSNPEAKRGFAATLAGEQRFPEADRIIEELLQETPEDPELLAFAASVALAIGDDERAVALADRAMELDPGCAEPLVIRARTKLVADQPADSESDIRQALALEPARTDALATLAMARYFRGDSDAALEYVTRALSRDPAMPAARGARSLLLLQHGALAAGWDDYENRFGDSLHRKMANVIPRTTPYWDGSPETAGRLLLYGEQGIGDQIMMASCLPDVMRVAGRCSVISLARLIPIFERSFPGLELIDFRELKNPLPPAITGATAWMPVASLPKLFRRSFDAFPTGPFLAADEEKIERWKARYAALGSGLKVGVSWRGGVRAAARSRRSLSIESFAPVFTVPGVHFINLQYGDTGAERAAIESTCSVTVRHWPDADPLRDMDDFMAQTAALDLVISTDNTTAHAAGSLGVRTLVLVPSRPSWIWMRERGDSPWYSSLELIRQDRDEDWAPAIARAAARLAAARDQVAAET